MKQEIDERGHEFIESDGKKKCEKCGCCACDCHDKDEDGCLWFILLIIFVSVVTH